jgi:hypothetical protein
MNQLMSVCNSSNVTALSVTLTDVMTNYSPSIVQYQGFAGDASGGNINDGNWHTNSAGLSYMTTNPGSMPPTYVWAQLPPAGCATIELHFQFENPGPAACEVLTDYGQVVDPGNACSPVTSNAIAVTQSGCINTPTVTSTLTSMPPPTTTMTSTPTGPPTWTPTWTMTITPSPTPTGTITLTPVNTDSPTPTFPLTATPTPTFTTTTTVTSTATVTLTNTIALTSTFTATQTPPMAPSPTLSSTPANPILPVLYPNPFKGEGTPWLYLPLTKLATVRVQIFTTAYRMISDMTYSPVSPGQPLALSMVGPDENPLSNGLYYVAVTVNGNRQFLKWLVLR